MEWTGEVHAEIHVSSTAKDTDFILRLSDVQPDGRSILLMDYPMRARYREGVADFLALLDAERTQLQAEDAVAQAESQVFTSVVGVYKALGGIQTEIAK